MAAVMAAPGLPLSRLQSTASESLNTLPDPRSPSASPAISRAGTPSPRHPDLSSEVATLSDKLISAINHQTNLDDTLAATRHELEDSRERIRELQCQAQAHADMLANGLLVRKADVDNETLKLVARLADERSQRITAEKDKRRMEHELESLTSALFEEANQMVAAARKEQEATEKRNEQLRGQLKDADNLLVSHQEQLVELKTVLQNMPADRNDQETSTNVSSVPNSPALQTGENINRIYDAFHLLPTESQEIPPAPPTSFTHLISPVLRTDLQSYEDFLALMQLSRSSAPPSRVSSGSYAGLNVMGLANLTNRDSHASSNVPSNASTTSFSTAATNNGSPVTPITPASANSSVSSRDAPSPTLPLKETKFYKRALAEDIEPTLRLDTAPGLSWLARRTVVSSMSEGSLVVEPMPASAKTYIFSCALCGEHRKGPEFLRTHRFRTSESDNAQRYPLCNYCLNRVRASCDFLGFLRMVKDGHWRTNGILAEKAAWEESVRLRERMFWARMGGGVIPAFLDTRNSPRESVEDGQEPANVSAVIDDDVLNAKDVSPRENEDPFRSDEKRVSIGNTVITRKSSRYEDDEDDWETAKKAAIFDDSPPTSQTSEDQAAKQLRVSLQESLRIEPVLAPASGKEYLTPSSPNSERRLSIAIPGAFQ